MALGRGSHLTSQIYQPTLDKNLNEPGTNWPLWKGTRVHVSMGGASDRVGPLHTEMGAYKGGDWHHHAWYLVFQRAIGEHEQPPDNDEDTIARPDVPGGLLDPSLLRTIREQSWNQVHINFNSDSSFIRYARAHNLGAPLTNEYDIGNVRIQGFAGGIAYVRIGDWSNIRHMEW